MIFKIFNIIKRDGFARSIVRLIARGLDVDIEFQAVKSNVLDLLTAKFDYTVAYGAFTGMRLNEDMYWAPNDRITQLLGSYEEHITERLMANAKSNSALFVDVGAADGYFAVGLTFAQIFDRAVAFEISAEGRSKIIENAKLNGVSDLITVQEKADEFTMAEALTDNTGATVLIDIEGAEYDFLSESQLSQLKDQNIICELHPWLVDNGYDKEQALLERCSSYFDVELITRDTVSPNKFEELNHLSDEERLVVLGEGRAVKMRWLVLCPRIY